MFGTTYNSHTLDCNGSLLTRDILQNRAEALYGYTHILFVDDEICCSQNLKQMQGGKSHACISGTQDMAHLTCSYYDSQFDGLHVTLNYTKQQPRPSPVLMPEYEKVFMTMLLDNIFLKRKSIDRSSAPGMTGHTVTIYNTYKDLSKWIGLVDVVFDNDNVPTQFKQAPNNIGRVGIQEGRYTKG